MDSQENDNKLFGDMLEIYNKIDKWWINEIEILITENDIPEDYDRMRCVVHKQ